MDIRYVQNITYTCPCGTCIKFKIPQDAAQDSKLSQAVRKLTCPKCGEDLSFDAQAFFDAVKEYNYSVENLRDAQQKYKATPG